MTAVDLDPVAFIDLAADAGFDEVSLFVNAMGPRNRFPTVDRGNTERVRAQLRNRGLRIANVESFTVAPGAGGGGIPGGGVSAGTAGRSASGTGVAAVRERSGGRTAGAFHGSNQGPACQD